MKLILSSCDFRNEHSRKVIIDHLNKPITECCLLFIPNEKATYEKIHSNHYYNRMQELGFTRNLIHVFDYDHAEKFLDLKIDVIYISGGNTFETLNKLRECNFDKEIIRYVKHGTIYIGGSAGAHIVSLNVEHVSKFDTVPEGMKDFKGLGLLNGILVCHYTLDRKVLFDQLSSNSVHKVYSLKDDESLLCCTENGILQTTIL